MEARTRSEKYALIWRLRKERLSYSQIAARVQMTPSAVRSAYLKMQEQRVDGEK